MEINVFLFFIVSPSSWFKPETACVFLMAGASNLCNEKYSVLDAFLAVAVVVYDNIRFNP